MSVGNNQKSVSAPPAEAKSTMAGSVAPSDADTANGPGL
jgi:hypothetical protein